MTIYDISGFLYITSAFTRMQTAAVLGKLAKDLSEKTGDWLFIEFRPGSRPMNAAPEEKKYPPLSETKPLLFRLLSERKVACDDIPDPDGNHAIGVRCDTGKSYAFVIHTRGPTQSPYSWPVTFGRRFSEPDCLGIFLNLVEDLAQARDMSVQVGTGKMDLLYDINSRQWLLISQVRTPKQEMAH